MTTCSEHIFSQWGDHRCSKPVTVQREGKLYCTIHDPERIAQKQAERDAEWQTERLADAQKRLRAECAEEALKLVELWNYPDSKLTLSDMQDEFAAILGKLRGETP